jgi:hypothetical protein
VAKKASLSNGSYGFFSLDLSTHTKKSKSAREEELEISDLIISSSMLKEIFE